MTHDLPIPRQDDRSDGASVIEWGTEDESPAAGRFRRSLGGLGRDHRIPVLLAGLGAVAALASLLGEWSTITIPNGGPDPETSLQVTSGVANLGLGPAYLVGLLALGVAVALALRGTDPVRANARVAGLALVAGMLALLATTAVSLGDTMRRSMYFNPELTFVVEYERGLIVAFVAVGLFAAALARTSPGAAEARQVSDGSRRRSRRPSEEAEPEGDRPPADITVTPTVPFAREAPPD
ncbi:hypothetical protein ACFFMR_15625 [Micromonospora andamanensis]|uniref:DUF4383 domain-containing protein n=1 Tax=Micromonospora andamanensis TaxID=1287068 RepID=A0ABQ4HYH3_9ACTN|nr:hypothetical protein [Micromonospora andamanensis]GIJ10666.1 hypothetical protein Van01_38800 [Micromonospora andamanensis]